MSFPLDFGMVLGAVADDGDPVDVLVIGDEPAVAGCVVTVRLLGIIKAEQTEKGRTYRNNRLLARKALSISYAHASYIDALGPSFVDHLGRWFEQFNALKGKRFKVIGIGGPDAAVETISRHIGAGSGRSSDGVMITPVFRLIRRESRVYSACPFSGINWNRT